MPKAVALQPGVRVVAQGRLYEIRAVVDLETVMVSDVKSRTQCQLRIQELAAIPGEGLKL